jgi:hypothetical protein
LDPLRCSAIAGKLLAARISGTTIDAIAETKKRSS